MSHYVSEPDFAPDKMICYCTRCHATYSYNPLDHDCKRVDKVTVSVRFSLTSAWIGVHYSKRERRVCINLVPFVTIWVALKGGRRP